MSSSRDRKSEAGVVHFRSRRKRARRELTSLTINLAPMVDVVFLLLVFFISTTTFQRAEGLLPAELPYEGNVVDSVSLPITPIFVHVIQTGSGPVDYSLTVEGFADQPTTFDELTAFLKNLQENPGFDSETPVVIQTKASVRWDHVVGCWNAAVRADCKRVSFGLD
jgi:biopolymer transport protein ExbD